MTDLQKAQTNYELAIQILANNPIDENFEFVKLQQRIYDHVRYGKMTLAKANTTEKCHFAKTDFQPTAKV